MESSKEGNGSKIIIILLVILICLAVGIIFILLNDKDTKEADTTVDETTTTTTTELAESEKEDKETFMLYAQKILNSAQTQYVLDANNGEILSVAVYVYDITKDLDLSSTGDYEGYVIVDASYDLDKPIYYLTIKNKEYKLINYDTSKNDFDIEDVQEVTDEEDTEFSDPYVACHSVVGTSEDIECYALSN